MRRAEQWTALELAELVEEPRLWLAAIVLDIAQNLDWPIESTAPEAMPDEPSVEISAAFAALRHLADAGYLKEGQ